MDVSRSGRVRKKSSKLAEFESDIEHQQHRKDVKKEKAKSRKRLAANEGRKRSAKSDSFSTLAAASAAASSSTSSSEDEDGASSAEGRISDEAQQGSLLIDDAPRPKKAPKKAKASAKKASNYFLEPSQMPEGGSNGSDSRSTKKGGIGDQKATAFSLWAKKMRPKVEKRYAGMGFADISYRLNDIWSDLPRAEKASWQAKAKRFCRKLERASIAYENSFSHSNAAKGHRHVHHRLHGTKNVDGKRSLLLTQPENSASTTIASMSPLGRLSANGDSSSGRSVADQLNSASSGPYKVIGTDPLDCAAHLKLLGESLSVIGERLTEHQGQIAVSGSLSVLLDSLLCASAPLLCLTQQVPELCRKDSLNQLSKALDNIAYIMPGL